MTCGFRPELAQNSDVCRLEQKNDNKAATRTKKSDNKAGERR